MFHFWNHNFFNGMMDLPRPMGNNFFYNSYHAYSNSRNLAISSSAANHFSMMSSENGLKRESDQKDPGFSIIGQQLQQPCLLQEFHPQQPPADAPVINTFDQTPNDNNERGKSKGPTSDATIDDPAETPNDLNPWSLRPRSESASPKTVDDGRSLRKSRKRTNAESGTTCCPVCGVTLRQGEVSTHMGVEVDRLNKISRGRKSHCKDTGHRKKTSSMSSNMSSNMNNTCPDGGETSQVQPSNRYETYLRVKAARVARLSGKNKGKKRKGNETVCPVCNAVISGTSEELNQHVENCLSEKVAEDEDVDIEGDGQYEEYEWAGQTRIRATTMLDGGSLAGVGMKASSKVEDEDEDMDLNVDEDDEQHFGLSQYSEADIIPCTSTEPEEDKQRRALRRAFLKAKGEKVPHHNSQLPGDRRRWEEPGGTSSSATQPSNSSNSRLQPPSPDDSDSEDDEVAETEAQYRKRTENIIAALTVKIKEQEIQLSKTDHPKCLICQDSYQKPLVSVHCWHVHCEECWLRSLGAKKLCPQCNTITSASDLRRIFL